MFNRFDSWASRNRTRLAVAVVALFALTVVAAGLEAKLVVAAGSVLGFAAFVALAVGIRFASGGAPHAGGGSGGGGFSDVGDGD